jgi:hypothetical protein
VHLSVSGPPVLAVTCVCLFLVLQDLLETEAMLRSTLADRERAAQQQMAGMETKLNETEAARQALVDFAEVGVLSGGDIMKVAWRRS